MAGRFADTSVSEPLAGPIEGLANELLLHIFTIIAEPLPEYNPATVKPDYPAFAISQVSRRWRAVAGMCPGFWSRLVVDLPGLSHGRGTLTSLPLLQLALRQSRVSIELRVNRNNRYLGGSLEDEICRWLANNPGAVTVLKMEGNSVAYTLVAIANALRGKRLSGLKSFTLDVPRYDNRQSASNRIVRYAIRLLPFGSDVQVLYVSLNQPFANSHITSRRVWRRNMPSFIALPGQSLPILTTLHTMTIVNSPALLSFARSAKLSTLSLTCSTAYLKDDLMHQLADVLESSRESLTTLRLHGWMCWGDDRLLSSLSRLVKVNLFELDFYVSLAMVTHEKSEDYNVVYVNGVVACWTAICQAQALLTMVADCICCDGSNLMTRTELSYIFDRMEEARSRSGCKAAASYLID